MLINLKKARKKATMSQKEVSITLGVSGATVSDWESGKIAPTIQNLLKLSDLLETTPNYLLGIDFESSNYTGSGTEAETQLVSTYHSLNEEGQEKLLDYANDLSASGRYKKDSQHRMAQKEA